MTDAPLATHALKIGAQFGEGPIWIDDALWLADIKRKRIYRRDPAAFPVDIPAAPLRRER